MYEEIRVNSERWFNLKPLKNEVWRNIKDFEFYQVSNYGRIKSLEREVSNHTGFIKKENKILTGRYSKKGYIQYILYKDNKQHSFKGHRLCISAFVENTNNLPQVNHINGNKEDNRLCNLEYCTNQYNQIHAWRTGLRKIKYGKDVHNARSVDVYTLDKHFIKSYDSIADALRELKLSNSSHIVQCCKGTRKRAYNYIWRYKGDELC